MPCAIVGRFRDNVYLMFIDVPKEALEHLTNMVGLIVKCIYDVPMKWDPDCESPSWCECEVEARKGFHLYRKGMVRSLSDVEDKEWDRWVPTVSANAKAVLRSLLPSLAQKCLWYAVTRSDMNANFRSLFSGIGWH